MSSSGVDCYLHSRHLFPYFSSAFHLFLRVHAIRYQKIGLVFAENVLLPVEEGVAKRVQLSKGFLGVDH